MDRSDRESKRGFVILGSSEVRSVISSQRSRSRQEKKKKTNRSDSSETHDEFATGIEFPLGE